MKTLTQYIEENKIVYHTDKNYEEFLQYIKYLPEEEQQKRIKRYLDVKLSGKIPNILELSK